jgi:dGTPase
MTYTQSEMEIHEDQVLAAYSNRSQDSKGRVYPDLGSTYKTNYQLDRDRIRYTHAFRRLGYQSQVLFSRKDKQPRTRLAHTLEVVQSGRTIARALGANEDLVEALCLARNLGNTAFGPAGEPTLARLLKDYGLFDHRLNSLKLLTERERVSIEFPGINPTWEVREGLVKLDPPLNSHEASEFNPELRAHFEAQIVSIAYSITSDALDLFEGIISNIISIESLDGLTLWEIMLEGSRLSVSDIDEISLNMLLRYLLDYLTNDLIQTTEKNILDNKINSPSDVQLLSFNTVTFSSDLHRRVRELKDFLYTNLYNHPRIVKKSTMAEKLFCELFEAYQSEPVLLPGSLKDRINKIGLEQAICEHIADLSNTSIVFEHKCIYDPSTLL